MHTIRKPRRVASSSIAGHRYGFVQIAHEWISLKSGAFLVVEANEDVDLVDGASRPEVHTEIQYKHSARSFGPRNQLVYGALAHFLEAWSDHTQQGREFRGVLTTTARFSESRRSEIGAWILGHQVQHALLQKELLILLSSKAQVTKQLLGEISTLPRFVDFAERITWQANSPSLDEELTRLRSRLEKLIPDLDSNIAADRILDAVLRAAGTAQEAARRLTRRSLWEALNDATLEALSRPMPRGDDELVALTSNVVSGRWRATCVLIANRTQVARIGAKSSAWGRPSDDDWLATVGGSVDFVCYVAVSIDSARNCRNAARLQATHAYRGIGLARDAVAAGARSFAALIADRCIVYEAENRRRAAILPFVAKLRWLRLSAGDVLTARDLLTSEGGV